MSRSLPLQAALFDMDGTLIDSEYLTDRAVREVFARYQVQAGVLERLDLRAFHGVAWHRIAALICAAAPQLAAQAGAAVVQAELQASFHGGLLRDDPREIPGAVAAVTAAAAHLAVGLVSSSDRASVDHVVARLGLGDLLRHRVCAEDCDRTKPDPEGYLRAASLLGVAPEACLVFEDSEAGLKAARAAGMRTVAIAGGDPIGDTDADQVIADFTVLPPGFFRTRSGR